MGTVVLTKAELAMNAVVRNANLMGSRKNRIVKGKLVTMNSGRDLIAYTHRMVAFLNGMTKAEQKSFLKRLEDTQQ